MDIDHWRHHRFLHGKHCDDRDLSPCAVNIHYSWFFGANPNEIFSHLDLRRKDK